MLARKSPRRDSRSSTMSISEGFLLVLLSSSSFLRMSCPDRVFAFMPALPFLLLR
jgi:hypothetical protein